ncbi:MAG: signal peptidase I [bacterium]|nr:signal peptidase I [bacterium]
MSDAAVPGSPARPKPVLAVLLSLLSAGLGHVYAGSVRRALAFVALGQLIGVMLVSAFVSPLDARVSAAAGAAAICGFWVLVLVDAGRTARRTRQVTYTARRRFVYCLFLYLGSSGVALAQASVIRTYWIRAFRAPTGSMTPGILMGDRFMVDMRAYRQRDPLAGEIAAFRYPRDPKLSYIMRIVGVPEDSVSYQNSILLVNGAPVTSSPMELGGFGVVRMETLGTRSYPVLDKSGPGTRDQEPRRVPDGGYYVLGDNRRNSQDSRYFGCVARGAMIGPILKIYFSRDPETKRIRWERIGRTPTS